VRITVIVGVLVAIAASVFPMGKLEEMVNIGTLFAFVLVSAGVIVLRRVEPDRLRPFRAPWVPLTPIISILTCLYLMLQLPILTWIRFGIWLLLGLAIYFSYGKANSRLGKAAEARKAA
jgi:APA family basic amino acid/polyamine antiporter